MVDAPEVGDVQSGQLALALEREFGGEAKVVVRQAVDLRDSEYYSDDVGEQLTVGAVVGNLRDAPEECTDTVERWNWWVGALALAYGDHYSRFTVHRPPDIGEDPYR